MLLSMTHFRVIACNSWERRVVGEGRELEDKL